MNRPRAAIHAPSAAAGVLALWKRELYSYAVSPVAYIGAVLFTLKTGYDFSILLVRTGRLDLLGFIEMDMIGMLLFLCPLLTMRSLAGEQADGTAPLLLSSPLEEWQIVLGKFLSAWSAALAPTTVVLPFWAIVSTLGDPDPGPALAGYLALLLASMLFCAIGVFCSSTTSSPLAAAIMAFGTSLFFMVIGWVSRMLQGKTAVFVEGISVFSKLRLMCEGVIHVSHVFYVLTLCLFFLFLAERNVSSLKWR